MNPIEAHEVVKQECPGSLLIFKVGDFYELFHDDATEAAKTLGLSITTRSKKGEDPVSMCGFPHHVIDACLAKLIKAGHRAVVINEY